MMIIDITQPISASDYPQMDFIASVRPSGLLEALACNKE